MVVNEAIIDQQIVTWLDGMPDKTIEPHLQTRKTQLEFWKHTTRPGELRHVYFEREYKGEVVRD